MAGPTAGGATPEKPHTETMIETLVLATANSHKVTELQALIAQKYGESTTVLERPAGLAETVEDGATLEQNALKKAVEVAGFCGQVALADDTGLFVAALDGRPGVRSARFAGPGSNDGDNVAKLLRELDGQPDRSAYFETVMALWWPDGSRYVASGRIEGQIVESPRGSAGFGYDPVFEPFAGDGRTFGEMSESEKNSFSHRKLALAAVLDHSKWPS